MSPTIRNSWTLLVVLLLVAALAGCEPISPTERADIDDAADVATDTTVDDAVVGEGATALFDLAAARSGEAFYDFPFPSDLRLGAGGHPDMTGFPAPANSLIDMAVGVVASENVGFTPNGATYFRFDGPLDAASLPSEPAAALSSDAAAQIIDIDPASPTFGERLPAYVSFRAARSSYWRSNTLTVRTVPGVNMRPATRYAVIATTALRAADGAAVAPSAAFEALKRGEGDTELVAHYGEVFTRLEEAGVALETVVAATAFTTSDVARQVDALREAVHAHPGFAVTDWVQESEGVYLGRFETLEFFGPGTPPYEQPGEGRFEFDAQGRPLGGTVRSVQLAISVPTGVAQPPNGFPIVVYGHGTGGGHDSHLGGSGEGSFLALEGLATIGFDSALHGDRVPAEIDVETLLASNPIAAREVVRQTVVDTMVVYRLLAEGALDIPATVTGGEAIRFDPSFGLYMGHSQGSQEAGLLAGVEPDLRAAFLSAGGAGVGISVVERKLDGQPISCLLGLVIGITKCEELTEDHPVMTLLVQPLFDGGDPLNYARRFIKEPLPGHAPRHIVMSQGTLDALTPPRAQDALAAAIGLPLLEPVVRTSDPLELLDLPRVTLPASGNLATATGAVTAGMAQWAGEGHFAIYRNVFARNLYIQFFKTAAAGTPTLVAP